MAVPPSSSSAADVEAEIDALYALPPGEFTAARDALAKRLRLAGARADAERVKVLRKPTPVAWALNRLSHVAAEDLVALSAAGDAQRGVVARGGPAASRRGARDEVARWTDRLVARAVGELGLGESLGQRLRATLEALAAWGTSPQAPAVGRLSEELAAPGFEVLAGLPLTTEVVSSDAELRLGRSAAIEPRSSASTGHPGPPAPSSVPADLRQAERRELEQALASAQAEVAAGAAALASAERGLATAVAECEAASSSAAAIRDELARLQSELVVREAGAAEAVMRRERCAAEIERARDRLARAARDLAAAEEANGCSVSTAGHVAAPS